MSDFRFAVRTLRKRPGFTAAVVLTLALGIGASTAMFSLIDAALLRPLPFKDPARLGMLWGVAGPERQIRGGSFPEVADWRAMNRSLESVSVYDETSLNLRDEAGGEPARVEAEMVSANFFAMLGVRPARGRTFLAEEDSVPDARPVAVISHALWTTRFNGEPNILGRSITLNDRPFTVVGVMPEGFKGLSFDTEVWIPSMMVTATTGAGVVTDRGTRWLAAVARLRPGISPADAQRDLDQVAARLTAAYPQTNTDRGVRLMSMRQNYLGTTEGLLGALFGAVLLFLLIACANVTSLQLVRATARRREIAMRLALGADRTRLLRQLLVEGLVLAALGGVAGVLLAFWGVDGLLPLVPDGALPAFVRPAIDARALGFTLLVVGACGVLCGLAPALLAKDDRLADSLRDGTRMASGGLGRLARPGLQQVLVVVEVALALVLLTGAGLLARSVRRQLAISPGFQAEGVLAARVTLPRGRYTPARRAAFAEELSQRLAGLPGVRAASVSSDLPFTGNSNAAVLSVPGGPADGVRYYRHVVTPDYFTTLGIPMLRGRGFTSADRGGRLLDSTSTTPLVAVISAAAAERLWPGGDAVGKGIRLGGPDGPQVTVVGVAGTTRFRDLTTDLAAPKAEPDVYFPYAQRTDRDIEIAIRSRTAELLPAAALRREVAALDPTLPVFAVRPLAEALRRQSAAGRFGSLLLGVFSGVALVLAAIGLYGLIAFVVGLSRREIAIRMALGADTRGVLSLIVRNGMALVGAGVVLGLAAAAVATRALASQLVGVSTRDPLTFAVVSVALLAVALAASWLPARKATRVDPQLALKSE